MQNGSVLCAAKSNSKEGVPKVRGAATAAARLQLLGLHVTKKEVEAMLAEVDRDGSGKRGCTCCCGLLQARAARSPSGARRRLRRQGVALRRGQASFVRACAAAGEVEFAEFLEIMTVQLNRMAEQREGSAKGGGGGSSRPRAGGEGGSGAAAGGEGGGEGAAAAGAPDAASLPFDVVAYAYRRKKLLEALDQDNKWVEGWGAGLGWTQPFLTVQVLWAAQPPHC